MGGAAGHALHTDVRSLTGTASLLGTHGQTHARARHVGCGRCGWASTAYRCAFADGRSLTPWHARADARTRATRADTLGPTRDPDSQNLVRPPVARTDAFTRSAHAHMHMPCTCTYMCPREQCTCVTVCWTLERELVKLYAPPAALGPVRIRLAAGCIISCVNHVIMGAGTLGSASALCTRLFVCALAACARALRLLGFYAGRTFA